MLFVDEPMMMPLVKSVLLLLWRKIRLSGDLPRLLLSRLLSNVLSCVPELLSDDDASSLSVCFSGEGFFGVSFVPEAPTTAALETLFDAPEADEPDDFFLLLPSIENAQCNEQNHSLRFFF